VALTAYGMMLFRRRYGLEHRRWLTALLESQWYSEQQLADLQLMRLQDIVDHAFETVPYYRDSFRRVGYRKGDIKSLRDLESLPVLEKEELRRDPERFVSIAAPTNRLVHGRTSGTTGTPISTFKDRNAYQRNWAFQERVRRWFGIGPRETKVTLWGRHVVSVGSVRPPYWRRDYFTRNWLFSIYHLSDHNLPLYVETMARIRPVEIHGYPSAVAIVARAVLAANERRIRPRAVITSAETVLDEQRSLIEEAFGCKLRDQYGLAENVAWVSQCEAGTYHVHPEYGILETLRGTTSVIDEAGDVVGTGFLNRAMPLIRYRTGDTMVLRSEGTCECGRHFPVVAEVVGRTDDVLFSLDGRPLARLSPIFKGLQSVLEGQIVQDAADHLIVNIVPSGATDNDETLLRRRLHELFGERMRIDIARQSSIPRTKAGKFRYQVNAIAARGADPKPDGRDR
jgi:phenylacetate-CoA ligase